MLSVILLYKASDLWQQFELGSELESDIWDIVD